MKSSGANQLVFYNCNSYTIWRNNKWNNNQQKDKLKYKKPKIPDRCFSSSPQFDNSIGRPPLVVSSFCVVPWSSICFCSYSTTNWSTDYLLDHSFLLLERFSITVVILKIKNYFFSDTFRCSLFRALQDFKDNRQDKQSHIKPIPHTEPAELARPLL